jgi:hypothetical protein
VGVKEKEKGRGKREGGKGAEGGEEGGWEIQRKR